MVVTFARQIVVCVCVFSAFSTIAEAQNEKLIRAWTDVSEVEVDETFWLFIELKGGSVSDPILPSVENLIINEAQRRFARSITVINNVKQESRSFAFLTRAIEVGKFRIPAVKATVDGRLVESDEIEINVVSNTPPGQPAQVKKPEVRLYVDNPRAFMGKPFWLNLETSGTGIKMPRTLDIDGLQIDPRKVKTSKSFSWKDGKPLEVFKLQYYVIPERTGTFKVDPIEVEVDGLKAKSNGVTIDVIENVAANNSSLPPQTSTTTPTGNPTPKDFVSIEMFTDKNEVYQGETILLRLQLWRIQVRGSSINSGPSSGDTLIEPTAQGFYVDELEAKQHKRVKNNWPYTVSERRRLLYPLKTGKLKIGAWHWEGIALVDTFRHRTRRKYEYSFDAPEIDILVKPLPPSPVGFAGAVGEFLVQGNLAENDLEPGVPVEYTMVVRGMGNPDAIGAPDFPDLDWAQVGEPTSNLVEQNLPGDEFPSITKKFSFLVVPNKSGRFTIPEIPYAFFNPRKEIYEEISLDEVHVNVAEADESQSHIVIPESVRLIHRKVEVLAEDIHPAMELEGTLTEYETLPSSFTRIMLEVIPVFLFGLVFVLRLRKEKNESNSHHIRSRKAKGKGLKRLQTLYDEEHPEEELYKLLIEFIVEKLHLENTALTSSDVGNHLSAQGMDTELCDTVTSILKSCERYRYASEKISETDLQALIYGVEAAMHDLDKSFKKGGRK